MVLQERIELSTSPLPRVCSTTELLQRRRIQLYGFTPFLSAWRLIRRNQCRAQVQITAFFRKLARRLIPPVIEGRMSDKPDQSPPQKAKSSPVAAREARLKAALKANMGRRKAQARARAATDSPEAGADNNEHE
jgi:hypothetical protein